MGIAGTHGMNKNNLSYGRRLGGGERGGYYLVTGQGPLMYAKRGEGGEGTHVIVEDSPSLLAQGRGRAQHEELPNGVFVIPVGECQLFLRQV